jgi:hypothetical protein
MAYNRLGMCLSDQMSGQGQTRPAPPVLPTPRLPLFAVRDRIARRRNMSRRAIALNRFAIVVAAGSS